MLGAIVGDIVGSVYEFDNHRSKDFPLFQKDSKFTDDTILTIASADALMGEGLNSLPLSRAVLAQITAQAL